MPHETILSPLDAYNQELLANVHPEDWVNPTPINRYDLVVIGAGTAGLVVAAGAAGLGIGLKVALIEKHLMGGDCLNVGCVPSKCMLRSARAAADLRQSQSFGITTPQTIDVDFAAVMQRMRQLRASISPADSAPRFEKLGIDVYFGTAQFIDRETIHVGDRVLKFKKAAIASGARASEPSIPGLVEAGFLTNETVFSLVNRPRRLAVIGGGPLGCEFAQAFQRLGSEVTIVHKNAHLLDREGEEAAEMIHQALLKDGVHVALGYSLDRVETTVEGKILHISRQGKKRTIAVDEILVGTGRTPNVEGLNLEAVDVEYDPCGVKVNDYLQTTNPNIYAAGDVCMSWKFTHAADAAARIVIKNAFFSPLGLGRSKLSTLVMPWVTYTDPEVAHVGLSESEAKAKGIAFETIHIPFDHVDRAIADGEINGFVNILHAQGSDRILGATIVGRHAGEMISEVTLAIVGKRGLNTLSSVIHPYPTQAEAIKKAADAYRRKQLTPRTKQLLAFLAKLALLR